MLRSPQHQEKGKSVKMIKCRQFKGLNWLKDPSRPSKFGLLLLEEQEKSSLVKGALKGLRFKGFEELFKETLNQTRHFKRRNFKGQQSIHRKSPVSRMSCEQRSIILTGTSPARLSEGPLTEVKSLTLSQKQRLCVRKW